MNWTRALLVACALAVTGPASLSTVNAGYGYRQYYSGWHGYHGYYYRSYYYKPHDDYYGYKHHYVMYYPSHPNYYYYYNPYSKSYWGRCPCETHGEQAYSLLPEEERKGTLKEIPETAFPKPGKMPPIPESKDSVSMDLPPDDKPGQVKVGEEEGGQ